MNYSRRQLEALGETLGECVTRKEGGRIVYGGGGSSSAPSTQTQVSDLPDWAKPYAQETMEKTRALTAQPYQTYNQPRIAGFSPLQEQAQERAAEMTTSPQIGTASGVAQAAALGALGTGYQPGYFRNQFRAPGTYQPGQFSMLQAQAPELQQFQMGPAERVYGGQYGAPMMETAQTGYRPDLQTFQMGPAERVRTGSFTQPGMAERYMSPYIEQALEPQLREAQRASQIAGTQEAGQAVKMGAFGGSRAGLIEAERQRNLATQMGDIRARGLQSAYEQAQNLYGTEAQRQLAAQQANQQAGLTVGGQNLAAALGVQQLGTQTGLQTSLANLSAQQQANVQNQAAQLQAQGLTANQAMQAALANQQAGLTTGQQNLAAQLGVQQLGAGQNLQAQLANQQALQAAQQAAEASRQFGYGQQMTAAQQRAQYGQAAQQLAEQSRQYGAGLGLQGLQTALQGAGQLGNLGQAEFGQTKDILGLQSQFGAQQQALRQQGLSQAYQDFLNEQNYPYKQLGFMSDMIRGMPLGQQSTTQMYQAPGSMIGQVAGLGTGLMGLAAANKQFGFFKEGGEVKEYADGGSVDSANNVADIVSKLSDQQLAQAEQAAQSRGDHQQLQAIMVEKGMRASERSGLAGAFNQLPYEDQEQMMAGGGMVAFADGGNIEFDVGDPTAEGVLSVNPLDFGRAARGGKSIEEYYREPTAEVVNQPPPVAPAAPAAPAAPVAKSAPVAKGAPQRAASGPTITRKNASEMVQSITQASGVKIPEDKTEEMADSLYKKMMSRSNAERAEFKADLDAAKNRAKEIEARGLSDMLMKFGFGMAEAASRPGRRQGLAGALESAAAASPIMAQSIADTNKLKQAAEDNYTKLKMEDARYQRALEQGNMQLASSMASNISQRRIAQASLEQQIAQQDRMFGLEKEKLGIMRSQVGQPTAIQKIANDLQAADPKMDRKTALNEASRISGYAFKTESAIGGKLAAELRKIDEEFAPLKFLDPESKTGKNLAAQRQQRINEAYRLYGAAQPSDVTSSKTSDAGAGQMRIVNVR